MRYCTLKILTQTDLMTNGTKSKTRRKIPFYHCVINI